MAWVVDTCLLIDVLDDDPQFGEASACLLENMFPDGLVLCHVSYVELAPAFLGDKARQDDFLNRIGIDYRAPWQMEDTLSAHGAWNRYVELRRQSACRRRPVADLLIGSFAMKHGGLLTRNAGDFQSFFPKLKIRTD